MSKMSFIEKSEKRGNQMVQNQSLPQLVPVLEGESPDLLNNKRKKPVMLDSRQRQNLKLNADKLKQHEYAYGMEMPRDGYSRQ